MTSKWWDRNRVVYVWGNAVKYKNRTSEKSLTSHSTNGWRHLVVDLFAMMPFYATVLNSAKRINRAHIKLWRISVLQVNAAKKYREMMMPEPI